MKFGFVDGHRQVWPVRVMFADLGLSASGYYSRPGCPESQRSVANRELTEDIRLIHAESSGCYGPPYVHAALRRHGQRVGQSRVKRLTRRAGLRGLAALPRGAWTTNRRHGYPIAPNRLARNFEAAASNQIWPADLTYIPTGEGRLHLAAARDQARRGARCSDTFRASTIPVACTQHWDVSALSKPNAQRLNPSIFCGLR